MSSLEHVGTPLNPYIHVERSDSSAGGCSEPLWTYGAPLRDIGNRLGAMRKPLGTAVMRQGLLEMGMGVLGAAGGRWEPLGSSGGRWEPLGGRWEPLGAPGRKYFFYGAK